MTTKKERERRLMVVEERIHKKGWSMRVQFDLAEELGVHPRTVRNYKEDVVDEMRKTLAVSKAALRADFLVRLRGNQQLAANAGKPGAAGAMLRLEADVTGMLGLKDAVDPAPVTVVMMGIPSWGDSASDPSEPEGE